MNHQPKHRPSLYGFHAVSAAWTNPARTIQNLFITQESLRGFEPVLQQARAAGLKRPSASIVEKNQIDRMLPPQAVHQGIALVTDHLPEIDVQDLMIRLADCPEALIVILDQVTDPHNVGAIIRSACAFGAAGMIVQKKHAPEFTGVLAKTACGGVDYLPVAVATNLSRAIEDLQENGFFVVGLDERGQDLETYKPAQKTAFVLGSEGDGMRRLIKEKCDVLIRLPTIGPIQSLNVSNAAAVSLFALRKR
jgi:23S rRNA (guanosine2251-2'-O)-methyltransferase